MFKFTKGKEMEELYELWSSGRIRTIISNGKYYSIVVVEPKTIIVEPMLDKKLEMSDVKLDFDINNINWHETSKLVKSNNGLMSFKEMGKMGASIIDAYKGTGWTLAEAAASCRVKDDDGTFKKGDKVETLYELIGTNILGGSKGRITDVGLSDVYVDFENGAGSTVFRSNLKLIKEDKVEKIVVRDYESFKKEVKSRYENITIDGEHVYFDNNNGFEIFMGAFTSLKCDETHLIKEAVEEFNKYFFANLEYRPVEVIDTFDKFREFLIRNNLTYKPWQKDGEIYCWESLINDSVKKAEQKYSVGLKILKEG